MQSGINQKTITLFRSLNIFQLIVLGLAYMQPLVVLDTFGIVSQKTNGHVAGAYLIATICLLFTAISYGKMSNRYPSSGSAYTYVQKTIGPKIGFLVGWTSLVDYLFMPLICVIQGKVYLASIFPNIDPSIFVVMITLVIAIPNIIGIKLVANINTLIVVLQIFILAVFILLMLDFIYSNPPLRPEVVSAHANWTQPNLSQKDFFNLNPFFSNESKIMPLLAGAGLLCFSFLGFDSLSNFAEETKNPKTTVPRGIFLTVLFAGCLFILISYLTQIIFPANFSFSDPENSSQPDIIFFIAGKFFKVIMLGFAIFSIFSSGIVALTGVSRLMYVMGRDNFLPKVIFGKLNPYTRTPIINIVIVGIICLTARFLTLEIVASVISFGGLLAFFFVNISVIIQYYVKDKKRVGLKNFINYLFLPTIGALSIAVLWLKLDKVALTFGIAWAFFGLIYLFSLLKIFNKNITLEYENFTEVVEESIETLEEAIEEADEQILSYESLEEEYKIKDVQEELERIHDDKDDINKN